MTRWRHEDCPRGARESRGAWRGRIPSRHLWHGVSVENRLWKSRVIPHLVSTRSSLRFVSIEPLLEDIGDISDWFPREREVSQTRSAWIKGVEWVIVGGESGPGARPFNVAWARSIVTQCRAAGVPVFVKQLGAKPLSDFDDQTPAFRAYHAAPAYKKCQFPLYLDDLKGGDIDEWPADLRVREFPRVAVPA